ncbi:MAG: cob(I)yrinic acid a,c-diamide adenosyltransferase [Spiroplasma phoeniceum]|nr:MAG: cob(I)yrinic acid a,c-diamide adenosyltransferase [Spiroplasma phoeniceum]
MTIRALGYQWNVKYLCFLKNRISGEMLFFQNLANPNLEIINYYSSSKKFFWEMNDQEKEILQKEMQIGFNEWRRVRLSSKKQLLLGFFYFK